MTRTIGALLAAGISRRFGPEDKLLAPFRGRPLASHAAHALLAVPVDDRVAVISSPALRPLLDDYEIVEVAPGCAHSVSLRAAVDHAEAAGAEQLLIVLADMPRVPPSLMRQVLEHAAPDRPASAWAGSHGAPPVCLPASMFDELRALDGDRGAGSLLRGAPGVVRVPCMPHLLADVDTQEDLAQLQ